MLSTIRHNLESGVLNNLGRHVACGSKIFTSTTECIVSLVSVDVEVVPLIHPIDVSSQTCANLRSARCTSRVESSRVESSRVGSGRVESGRVESSRVESSRVESSRVESGRVGSGRVGSGRVGSSRVEPVSPGSKNYFHRLIPLSNGKISRRSSWARNFPEPHVTSYLFVLLCFAPARMKHYDYDPIGTRGK